MMTWTGLAWEKKQEGWLNPVQGIITSFCGVRQNPILRKEEFHDGLDIAAPSGTSVQAVKSGTVTEVRTSDTYGKLLKYETADGYEVMYAHLSQILAKEGEEIAQGQIIAKSGNTGLSTGPHLHFEVVYNGTKINPELIVKL